MLCKCAFNPVTDVCEVVAGLSIEVVESMDSGSVAMSARESFHNMLDSIDKVGRRVSDIFDALDNAKLLNKSIVESVNSAKSEDV